MEQELYFRIQDDRSALPKRSRNYWTGYDSQYFVGVSAFLDFWTAVRDLVLGKDVDGLGINYAGAIREEGGTPCLSIFSGEFLEDDSTSGVIVRPKRKSEKRYSSDQIKDAFIQAISHEFTEIDPSLSWDAIEEEYDLESFAEDALKFLIT